MATKNLMVRIGIDMSDLAGATDRAKGHFEKLNAVRKSATENQRDTLTKELEKAQQQVQKLEADYKRMTGSMGQMGTENGLLRQLKQVESARAALDKQWSNKDGSLKSSTPDSVLEQYGVLTQRADELYSKIRQVRLDPAATEEAQALSAKLEEARQNAQNLQDELEKTGTGGGGTVGAKMLDGLTTAGNAARNALEGVANIAGRGLATAASGARTAAQVVGTGLKNAAQNAFQGVRTLGSGIASLAGRIGGLAARALVFNVISAGFRQAQQGIAALAQSDSQLNASLAGMRGNLLAAFAPLWQTILPMVRAVAAALAQLAGIIAQVMAALFGTSVGAAQKSAAAYNKQATAAAGAAGSTKKAADEAKKAQREAMDFDVLHKMSDNGSEDTSDSGGGGGGGAAIPDFTTDLQAKSPFVDSLLDAINADDWYKVGALLAEKLNAAMADIPWDEIRTTAHNIASRIADTLNGFVETLNWNLVGNALGNGLNVAMDFLDTFVQDFHWDSLGRGIGNGLESMRQTVDWETAGRLLTDKFKALFETLHGFVTSGFNWRGLGDDVAKALNAAFNNVDWVQAAADLGQLARGIFQGASNAIQGVDWPKIGQEAAKALKAIDWGGIISDVFEFIGSAAGAALGGIGSFFTELFDGLGDTLYEYFGDIGEMTIEGFFDGMLNLLSDIAAWVDTHVVTPFVNGVKKALGIHSPSTVMAEIGGYTVEGFLNGISDGWGAVTGWVSEHLGNLVQSFTDWKDQTGQKIGEWADNTRQTVSTWVSDTANNVGGWVSARKQDFTDWKDQTGQRITEWADTARQTVSTWADNTAQSVTEWSAGRKQDFVNWKTATGSTLTGWANVARATISEWANAAAGFIQDFATRGQGLVQSFAGSAQGLLSGFASQASSTLSSWASAAASAVQGFGSQAQSAVNSAVNGMQQTLQGLASSAWSWGSDFMGNFANAVSSRANDVLNSVRSMAQNIRSYMHFTVPDRGPLADADTWMPDFMTLLAHGVESNSPALLDRVQNVARQINGAYSEMMQGGTVTMRRSVTVDTDPLGMLDNGTGDIITTLRSGFDRLQRAVENKDSSVYMDGDKVEDITAKSRRKRALMYGEA